MDFIKKECVKHQTANVLWTRQGPESYGTAEHPQVEDRRLQHAVSWRINGAFHARSTCRTNIWNRSEDTTSTQDKTNSKGRLKYRGRCETYGDGAREQNEASQKTWGSRYPENYISGSRLRTSHITLTSHTWSPEGMSYFSEVHRAWDDVPETLLLLLNDLELSKCDINGQCIACNTLLATLSTGLNHNVCRYVLTGLGPAACYFNFNKHPTTTTTGTPASNLQ